MTDRLNLYDGIENDIRNLMASIGKGPWVGPDDETADAVCGRLRAALPDERCDYRLEASNFYGEKFRCTLPRGHHSFKRNTNTQGLCQTCEKMENDPIHVPACPEGFRIDPTLVVKP